MSTDLYKRFMPDFAAEFDDLAEVGTRPVTHLVTDAAALTPRIELLPGSGHSPGDLMVLVDDAEVLFLGGLGYFGVTPLAFQGDPATWSAVLGTLPDLAEKFVPGHGPVGGPADVMALADYLQACCDAAGDPAAIPSGPWDRWLCRDRDAINVERAHMLAQGEDPTVVPPTMLRALGL
jgi:glyoxylase-like metal-dependent hydrolase (beta-lactamase superfamily II)